MYSYPMDIPSAARFLDTVKAGWHNMINVDILNMDTKGSCILGQLFSNYRYGMEAYFDGINYRASDYIFGSNASKELWVAEINARRLQPSVEANILWAVAMMREGLTVHRRGTPAMQWYLYHDSLICNGVALRFPLTDVEAKDWVLYAKHVKIEDLKQGDCFKRNGNKYRRCQTDSGQVHIFNEGNFVTGMLPGNTVVEKLDA